MPAMPSRGERLLGLVLAVLPLVVALACHRKPKLSSIEQSQLRPAQEWLRIEEVKDLFDYVRIDTTVSQGEEEGARFLQRLLDCEGIETEIVCPAPKRCNLLARLPGRSRQGALLLINHIDDAPILSKWKDASPFEGRIKLGYLYGRGVYDMKSTGLAEALAIRSLKRRGIVPAADILFLAEADEETDQRWGSRWLLEHRPEWFAGVANILNEGGSSEMILRDVRFWGLETLEAGFAAAELESAIENPLKQLAAHWPVLVSTPVEPHPNVREAFDVLADHLPEPLTDSLRHLDRALADPKELASLPARYGCFLEARIRWTGPVPDPLGVSKEFREYAEVFTPPGVSPDRFLQPIVREASSTGVRVVREISSGTTTASPYPTAFTELIKRVTQAHFPGVPFAPVPTSSGFNTSIFFRARGIPSYGFLPVATNITDAARRHGSDERIFLEDYLRGVDLYRDILEEFAFSGENKTSPQVSQK